MRARISLGAVSAERLDRDGLQPYAAASSAIIQDVARVPTFSAERPPCHPSTKKVLLRTTSMKNPDPRPRVPTGRRSRHGMSQGHQRKRRMYSPGAGHMSGTYQVTLAADMGGEELKPV